MKYSAVFTMMTQEDRFIKVANDFEGPYIQIENNNSEPLLMIYLNEDEIDTLIQMLKRIREVREKPYV